MSSRTVALLRPKNSKRNGDWPSTSSPRVKPPSARRSKIILPDPNRSQTATFFPPELKLREQWVLWRYEERDGKKTKIPYNARTGRRASATDPDTWCFLIEAREAYESNRRWNGIGFVLAEQDPLAGIDLDKARDPQTGAVAEWASEWVREFGGYAEISPSGSGLHIIVRGRAPNRKNQKAGVEAYSNARFFTFTGDAVATVRELPERQDVIDRFSKKYFPAKRHIGPEPQTEAERQPVDITDHELLEKARNASRGMGERFRAFYDRGDFLEHPSHSEARLELLRHLAYWTAWDAERMSRLYEGSALHAMPGYARKWDRLGQRETARAIAAQPKAFGQEARRSKADGGELAAVVEALRAQAAALPWEGRGGPTDRHVYGALIDIAAKYGTLAKRGVIFSADMRNLALAAGTSLKTAHKSLQRLREERKLIRLSKKGTSKRAAVYLLRYPTSTQGVNTKPCAIYVHPLSQMRNPGPSTEKEFDKNGRKISHGVRFLLRRLGKPVALAVERVAAYGESGVTVEDLAASLERRRYNVRRTVRKAVSAGLVIEDADGRLRTPEDLEWRLERELEDSGCVDARETYAKRYRAERDAFYRRRNNEADESPTDVDLEHERLQRVQDALDILQDTGTGPARILQSYLSGETRNFDYVVNAVAFYYGCAGAELWRQPVESAVELISAVRGPEGAA